MHYLKSLREFIKLYTYNCAYKFVYYTCIPMCTEQCSMYVCAAGIETVVARAAAKMRKSACDWRAYRVGHRMLCILSVSILCESRRMDIPLIVRLHPLVRACIKNVYCYGTLSVMKYTRTSFTKTFYCTPYWIAFIRNLSKQSNSCTVKITFHFMAGKRVPGV